jgi:hypothetical protein
VTTMIVVLLDCGESRRRKKGEGKTWERLVGSRIPNRCGVNRWF